MTGARKALIVASDTYDHEGLRHLRSPRADASALARVLGDPQVGDFEVAVVHNEPSYEVQARVEELFAESRPDDLLLLHFACHGLKSESGELFFAARNTRLGRLASTAVSADFVQRCMRSSRSRSIVLLLDCCYGGAFGQGVAVRAAGSVDVAGSFPAGRLEGGRGRAVITASSAMEYAFEGETLADDHSTPSVFTDALVRGLSTGEADRDEDGWVSLNELYEYVFDQVRTSTPGQTPTRDVEMQGELYLARSRRRRVQPAPVPPDLLAASHDANVFTRLGAVSELRARLLGDNLPAAAGAHQRLVEIAELDIKYVADAAARAVQDAALGLEPVTVAFGRLPQGTAAPPRKVSMSGPPLARTCAIEVSTSRIRADEVADGLEVSVDTASVGSVTGTVTVRGPLGEGVVRVHADVVAPGVQPAGVGAASLGHDEQTVPAAEAQHAGSTAPAAPAESPEPAEPARPTESADPAASLPDGEPVPASARAAHDTHDVVADAPSPVVPSSPVEPQPHAHRPTRRRAPAADGLPRIEEGDRWLRIGAVLAVVGAGLMVAGAAGELQYDTPVREDNPSWFGHTIVLAALFAACAALAAWPRTRWTAGTGLLLGVVAASTCNLVTLLTAWRVEYTPEGGLEPDFWLMVAGQSVAVLAGLVTARAVARHPGMGLGRPRIPAPLVWSLVAAGVLAGVTVMVSATRPDGVDIYWTIPTWAAVTATAVPAVVALARPRWFRVWLLVGWVVGAGVGLVRLVDIYVGNGAYADADAGKWIALALATLVPLAVLLARHRGGEARRPDPGRSGGTPEGSVGTDAVAAGA